MVKHLIRNWRAPKRSAEYAEIILHVGAPKCGSSAIQRFCVNHRSELLTLGYYYPEHTLDVNGVSGGHTQLAGALLDNKREQAAATLQCWLQEARTHRACLLLSAEALYGQHQAMAELCVGFQVRVIAFLRHPVEYLIANHNQGIKRHFSTKRLDALLPEMLGRPTGHLAGLPLLHWADAFGEKNCHFMAYQSPDAGGAPVESRFLMALGIPEARVNSLLGKQQAITNRSYVKSALELKRLLNTVLEGMPPTLVHQVDWSLQGYSDRARGEFGYTLADITLEMRERIEAHLLKQMEPVVERFPELGAAAEVPLKNTGKPVAYWPDLAAPLAALTADAPEAAEKIRKRAVLLRDQGRQDYAFCKLLELLGIEFNEPDNSKSTPGLTAHQRESVSNPKAREADCLRELALLLERQGLLKDALFAIECARIRRPTGEGIQRIKARIEQKTCGQNDDGALLARQNSGASRL